VTSCRPDMSLGIFSRGRSFLELRIVLFIKVFLNDYEGNRPGVSLDSQAGVKVD
jgi:hypothetical protein